MMRKKMREKYVTIFLWILSVMFCGLVLSIKSLADTIYDSPYVTWSPDGQAFTTNAGDRNCQWYDTGTIVEVGVSSADKALQTGQHYYRSQRVKSVPVGYWKVEHTPSSCIHKNNLPPGTDYHGIDFARNICLSHYYSGWFAYCADCGEKIISNYIYMSKEAALSIAKLDLNKTYYYLCPFCKNLEMGAELGVHFCREISWNRYQIRYDCNTSDWVEGYMPNSTYMYNNEQIYEGKIMKAERCLRKNEYRRSGYAFVGWNTRADGSGQSFQDEQEILNLTADNYDENGKGLIVLYAQWEVDGSILRIDPAGGSYRGEKGVSQIVGQYGEAYFVSGQELVAPFGNTVSFETNGGSKVASVTNKIEFKEWIPTQPLYGAFHDNIYYYTSETKSVDTITASYCKSPIILPETKREGYFFQGWYYDPECTKLAGFATDELIPRGDMKLYAKWGEGLSLYADIERILDPHEPIFRCGEGGRLSFTVSGYAEKVEVRFPKEFTERMPDLDRCYLYDEGMASHEEELIFMVPLYIPLGEYQIIVTAYKGDQMLTETLLLWTLGEEASVLNDIRSRLR